jgi:hypothetical protein
MASQAARIFSGVSLSSVGSIAVVPNRRCAAAMAAIPRGLGSSLNSTSPPPFTCVSMNPGTNQAPAGKWRWGIAAGSSLRCMTPRMRESSTTTAQSWRRTVPSKTWSAETANSISY